MEKNFPPDRNPVDPVEVAPIPNAIAQPPAPPGVEGKTTVDLIPLLDLKQDVVKGKWVVVDGVLHGNDPGLHTLVQIPYEPPEEYDFVVVFSQPKVRWSICLVMPNPRCESFSWELGGSITRMKLSTQRLQSIRPAQRFQANTAYTTVVEVRRDSVRCLLDGKEVLKADVKELKLDPVRKLTNPQLLGVGCDNPTVFHYVRVVEISGPGKKLR
jgi:hypothetical protein